MNSKNLFKTGLWLTVAICFLALSCPGEEKWSQQRKEMVTRDLQSRDIKDSRVLTVMGDVKRHLFIPETIRNYAYADRPLPIGEGQTISQPYIVALMSQMLEVEEGHKVLEIGTGSGYQAAVLKALGAEVYTIEINSSLANRAHSLFAEMKLPIHLKNDDGYYGWKEAAPFDRIIITAAANHIPPPLIEQLKPGGRLVLPLGNIRFYQTLTLVNKGNDGKLSVTHHAQVRFVPMTGKMLE